jgi:hypothetical protein
MAVVGKTGMTSASKYPATLSEFNPASALREWTYDPIRTNWTGPREKEIASVSISMHQSSVGVFTHFLSSLSDLLDHAAAHAENRKIDPSILLNARLYPNMYNLTRQVGEANRHAVLACALLTGVDAPVFPDSEPDIPELKARIATAKDFVGSLQPAQINGTEEKEVIFTFRSGLTRKFTGQSLLLTFSLPQFFFHVTTAYDILRHCGVELAKKDFLGKPGSAVKPDRQI